MDDPKERDAAGLSLICLDRVAGDCANCTSQRNLLWKRVAPGKWGPV